jgi:hypothetical protein
MGGPSADDFMSSIREVAVFAWALTGINGKIAKHSRGTPRGEAVPAQGFPIWDPHQTNNHDLGPENQAVMRWAQRERIEPPTLPLHSSFQNLQHEGHFANQNDVAAKATTNLVLPAPMPTENGHREPDPQCEHAQQQYVPPARSTTTEQNHPGLYLPASNGNQDQGSSGGSHPVQYMWY